MFRNGFYADTSRESKTSCLKSSLSDFGSFLLTPDKGHFENSRQIFIVDLTVNFCFTTQLTFVLDIFVDKKFLIKACFRGVFGFCIQKIQNRLKLTPDFAFNISFLLA